MSNWRKRFYKSKSWIITRALTVERDNSTCRDCGEFVLDKPEVHHTVELTEGNHKDPAISLNLDLLITLCHACHDKRHGRFGSKERDCIVNDDLSIDYSRR